MSQERAQYLLSFYLQQQLNAVEKAELFSWIDKAGSEEINELLLKVWQDFVPIHSIDKNKAEEMLAHITGHGKILTLPPARKSFRIRRYYAAAVVIILAGSLAYMFSSNKTEKTSAAITKITPATNDVLPGKTGARLTLADGSSVSLDSLSIASIPQQGNTMVISRNGELVYQQARSKQQALIFNVLSTGRGDQFPLTLSDGTKVFLNASSSIRFPVVFTGYNRNVEITGEAYFEVAKNGKPFIVHLGSTQIEVLGTHFNVNSYSDENGIKTTLLEGSVKIISGASNLLLSPGQEANVEKDGSLHLNKNANIEAAISWTQGYFHFDDATLETVLRQLSRWYDVDVVYEKLYPEETFEGDIQKSLKLSQVLKFLEKSQIKFRIEGKKLIVMK